jgi:hypothetical protein
VPGGLSEPSTFGTIVGAGIPPLVSAIWFKDVEALLLLSHRSILLFGEAHDRLWR